MKKTCIIPFSGGVESTATLLWALERGESPYVFHLVTNGYWESQLKSTKKISEELGIVVNYIKVDWEGVYSNYNLTKKKYKQRPPNNFYWLYWTQIIQTYNPFIKKVFIGFNGGLTKLGDNLSDIKSEQYHKTVKSLEELSGAEYETPLEHLTKLQQWNTIPKKIQDMTVSCISAKEYPCGKCFKCKERIIIVNNNIKETLI